MNKKITCAVLSFILAFTVICTSITCAFAASGSGLTVNTKSNLFDSSSVTLAEGQNQVRVTFELCLTQELINTDCEVIYDPAVLSPVPAGEEESLPNLNGAIIGFCESEGTRANSDKYGEDDSRRVVVFNASSPTASSDFSTQKVFVTILFDVVSGTTASSTDVELWVKYLGVESSSGTQYVVDNTGKVSSSLSSSIVKSCTSSAEALTTVSTATESTAEQSNTEATDAEQTSTESTVSTQPVTYPDPTMLGDVNGDGKINIADATMIQKGIAQILTLSDKQNAAANVNGDKTVSIADVTTIQKYIAQIISVFPAEE